MARYSILVRDLTGNKVGDITDFIRLEYARKENDIGVMTLTLPRSDLDPYIQKDLMFEIWRTVGTKTYLEGNTAWLLRKWVLSSDPNPGSTKTWTLTAYDMNYVLKGYEVEYAAGDAKATKTAAIDNIMKAIVRENLGTLATDTTRNLSTYIGVDADTTQATSTTKAYAKRNVLAILQELAQESYQRNIYLAFDVRYVSPYYFAFGTFINQLGVNRGRSFGNTLVVSEDRSSLIGATLTYDYTNEITVVNVGGTGRGVYRASSQTTDADQIKYSPFSRREMFQNAVQAGSSAPALDAEARAELYKNRSVLVLTGSIQDTDAMQYGIDYNFGDIVVAEHLGYSFDAHIDTIHVTVTKEGEVLDNRIRGVK